MTTTATHSTPTLSAARRIRIGAVGSVLWTLSPVVWLTSLEEQPYGTLSFVAVALALWICMVAAPLLLIGCHLELRASLGVRASRVGAAGIGASATGLAAMSVGVGIELASISAGGGEVVLGHTIMLIGFLLSMIGALLTGITVLRRRRDAASRTGGWILTLALPLGIGLAVLGGILLPDKDVGFWAALTVPTGVAWLLLSGSLATERRTYS